MVEVGQWSVFRRGHAGGNPCPVITEARELTPGQMQAIAAHFGHESAFVTDLTASRVSSRFFVPRHEMRMCVHATIAAITALAGSGTITGADAAAALAAYLTAGLRPARPTWVDITIDQGDAMGQPSCVRAAALAGPAGTIRTRVTGTAVRTGHAQITMPPITGGRDLPAPELR